MAKRPTSRSQADDTAAATPAAPKPRRARASKESASIPPGAPVPDARGAASSEPLSLTPAERAEAADDRPLDLDHPEALDALTLASTSMASEPSEHDIRMRAYHRYLERGGGEGREFDDWVEAERDLKARR